METKYQIELSSEEICVLAGMLGYSAVFGIGEAELRRWGADVKKHIKSTVHRLERKKQIRYDLDGILYMNADIRRIIDCMCDATTVCLYLSNAEAGKRKTAYFLMKDDWLVLFEPNRKKNRLSVVSGEEAPKYLVDEWLYSDSGYVQEKMLYEEAELIKQQLAAFDREGAMTLLTQCVKDTESASVIADALSGNCRYISVRFYQKDKQWYKSTHSSVVVLAEKQAIAVTLDEYDVLSFETVEMTTLIDQWQERLQAQTEGGAALWKV